MKNKSYRSISILTWVVIITLWVIFSEFHILPAYKLPSPFAIIKTFQDILINGYNYTSFWYHLGISLYRLLLSILLSLFTAIPLGLCCGFFPKFRAVINSFVNFYRNLPPLAYYSLLIIWLGIDEKSKVTLLFLASFAPMYLSSMFAVSRINPSFILSAETFGASKVQIFKTIIIPAAFPEIFVGIRTAVGVAYTTLVSAEMIAATAGVGWMVIDAYKYINTEVVFVGIIIMGLTGLLLDYLLTLIEKKYIFWTGK
ncbi:MAG: ABC transporter permease [Tissierellia bacterium]|nr:ABC transporter permease [Tissierellia bacterium]